MCDRPNFLSQKFSCKEAVIDSGSGEFTVDGSTDAPDGSIVIFWAANPPNYNTSFSGSGLPYPNPDVAFDNTPNQGATKVKNGSFKFKIRYPSSFYAGLGSLYLPPQVYYKVCQGEDNESKVHVIKIGEGIPFRSLTYAPPPTTAPRRSPMFYSGGWKLPVRTQEQILRDSAYPSKNEIPSNFWGLRPPS